MIDIGGEKNERRKWVHLFFDNSCVLTFFVSLSEYAEMLWEDNSVNRMSESLKLFHQITTYKFFTENRIPIVLIFTKYDLFKQRIKQIPLSFCFLSYQGNYSCLINKEKIIVAKHLAL